MKGTEQGKTFLVSPSPATSGDKRTAPLQGNNSHMVLKLPEKVWAAAFPQGQLVSLHLYWKVNLNLYHWRKWWRTFHRFLAIINTLLRNQIFCSFVSAWEILNKTTQLSTQRHSQKALEIKWSTEGNHDSSMLSVSQSTDRNNRGTAAALNSHSVPKTFI